MLYSLKIMSERIHKSNKQFEPNIRVFGWKAVLNFPSKQLFRKKKKKKWFGVISNKFHKTFSTTTWFSDFENTFNIRVHNTNSPFGRFCPPFSCCRLLCLESGTSQLVCLFLVSAARLFRFRSLSFSSCILCYHLQELVYVMNFIIRFYKLTVVVTWKKKWQSFQKLMIVFLSSKGFCFYLTSNYFC